MCSKEALCVRLTSSFGIDSAATAACCPMLDAQDVSWPCTFVQAWMIGTGPAT